MTTTPLADKLAEVETLQRAGQEVTPRSKSVLDLIKGRQGMYAQVLNKTIDPERFVRVALATVGRTPGLLACTQESLLGALMLSAQLGLEPGTPLGEAYLVPFGRECTFIVGYKGFLTLARRSGQIASIYAEAVFEGDEFSWELGLDRDIKHRPLAADRSSYEKVTHVYAVAKLRDKDADPIFVVLTRAQVEATRQRARAKNNGPWKTDPIPMALKTAVRRLSTWMPMSIEMAQAAAVDGQVAPRMDVNLDDFVDDLDVIDVQEVAPELSSSDPADTATSPGPVSGSTTAPDHDPAEESPDPLTVQQEAAALVAALDVSVQTSWSNYKRRTGISANPERWSDEQARGVIEFIEAGSAEATP